MPPRPASEQLTASDARVAARRTGPRTLRRERAPPLCAAQGLRQARVGQDPDRPRARGGGRADAAPRGTFADRPPRRAVGMAQRRATGRATRLARAT
jgi:hypothetical protein